MVLAIHSIRDITYTEREKNLVFASTENDVFEHAQKIVQEWHRKTKEEVIVERCANFLRPFASFEFASRPYALEFLQYIRYFEHTLHYKIHNKSEKWSVNITPLAPPTRLIELLPLAFNMNLLSNAELASLQNTNFGHVLDYENDNRYSELEFDLIFGYPNNLF